jgi:polysaccharide pyruvyl transferase WcaK-like protein
MKKDYYVVLHGAKKNVGDFLIRDRSKKLLRFLRPDRELMEFPSWEALDDKIDIVNKSKALIIMGGPGASTYFYPKYYPLIQDLSKLKVPFVLLGTGSYEKVYNDCLIKHFKFKPEIKQLLDKGYVSTRDVFTNKLFEMNNINAVMTGCPTFYNLDYINTPLNITNNKKIIFTPSADMIFKKQVINIMKSLKTLFKDYTIYCSFNRGYQADKFTTIKYENKIKDIVNIAEELGYIILDLSYNLKKMETIYNECDFHIGYRLHSHIHFISRRKPSFLITEDSRSFGHIKTLDLKILRGEKENLLSRIYCLNNLYIKGFINKIASPISPNNEIEKELIIYIKDQLDNNFNDFIDLPDKIDNLYKNMKSFILNLP